MSWASKVGEAGGAAIKSLRKSKGYEEDSVLQLCEWLERVVSQDLPEYADYDYLAYRLHLNLRKLCADGVPDVKKARQARDALGNFVADNLHYSYSRNFDLLLEYFRSQQEQRETKTLPRISLKINATDNSCAERVECVTRDQDVAYKSDCKMEENSGFLWVKTHGLTYLGNNVAVSAKKGDYSNPRLLADKVKSYSPRRVWPRPQFWKRPADWEDRAWIDCWAPVDDGNGGQVPADPRSCYRSTMIIPLTLRADKLSDRFKRDFGMGDVERVIIGYLCFDHPRAGFFRRRPDEYVGKMFAAILSRYLLTELRYTKISKQFNKISEFIAAAPGTPPDA